MYWILSFLIFSLTSCKTDDVYKGELFPEKYLVAENTQYDLLDVKLYLNSMIMILSVNSKEPNSSDINSALGFYASKAILKRTLLDYGDSLTENHHMIIKFLIKLADQLLSHFLYQFRDYDKRSQLYRISVLFKDEMPFIHSLSNFTPNRLKRWIHHDLQLHNFTKDIDSGSFTRLQYINLMENISLYNISISASDECIARVSFNPEPFHLEEIRPCRRDQYCAVMIKSLPSAAYTLSHRLVNNLLYHRIRRCYIYSEQEDISHMEMLCAHMYREVVYIARKGYFARDMYLEHIALCGMLGYEEFFRKHWFKKIASWIDKDGCIPETRALTINRTDILILRTKDPKYVERLRQKRIEALKDVCQKHVMALGLIVFAHAVRYSVHRVYQNRNSSVLGTNL